MFHFHKWSKWVVVEYEFSKAIAGMVYHYNREMQKRECKKCGKVQITSLGK